MEELQWVSQIDITGLRASDLELIEPTGNAVQGDARVQTRRVSLEVNSGYQQPYADDVAGGMWFDVFKSDGLVEPTFTTPEITIVGNWLRKELEADGRCFKIKASPNTRRTPRTAVIKYKLGEYKAETLVVQMGVGETLSSMRDNYLYQEECTEVVHEYIDETEAVTQDAESAGEQFFIQVPNDIDSGTIYTQLTFHIRRRLYHLPTGYTTPWGVERTDAPIKFENATRQSWVRVGANNGAVGLFGKAGNIQADITLPKEADKRKGTAEVHIKSDSGLTPSPETWAVLKYELVEPTPQEVERNAREAVMVHIAPIGGNVLSEFGGEVPLEMHLSLLRTQLYAASHLSPSDAVWLNTTHEEVDLNSPLWASWVERFIGAGLFNIEQLIGGYPLPEWVELTSATAGGKATLSVQANQSKEERGLLFPIVIQPMQRKHDGVVFNYDTIDFKQAPARVGVVVPNITPNNVAVAVTDDHSELIRLKNTPYEKLIPDAKDMRRYAYYYIPHRGAKRSYRGENMKQIAQLLKDGDFYEYNISLLTHYPNDERSTLDIALDSEGEPHTRLGALGRYLNGVTGVEAEGMFGNLIAGSTTITLDEDDGVSNIIRSTSIRFMVALTAPAVLMELIHELEAMGLATYILVRRKLVCPFYGDNWGNSEVRKWADNHNSNHLGRTGGWFFRLDKALLQASGLGDISESDEGQLMHTLDVTGGDFSILKYILYTDRRPVTLRSVLDLSGGYMNVPETRIEQRLAPMLDAIIEIGGLGTPSTIYNLLEECLRSLGLTIYCNGTALIVETAFRFRDIYSQFMGEHPWPFFVPFFGFGESEVIPEELAFTYTFDKASDKVPSLPLPSVLLTTFQRNKGRTWWQWVMRPTSDEEIKKVVQARRKMLAEWNTTPITLLRSSADWQEACYYCDFATTRRLPADCRSWIPPYEEEDDKRPIGYSGGTIKDIGDGYDLPIYSDQGDTPVVLSNGYPAFFGGITLPSVYTANRPTHSDWQFMDIKIPRLKRGTKYIVAIKVEPSIIKESIVDTIGEWGDIYSPAEKKPGANVWNLLQPATHLMHGGSFIQRSGVQCQYCYNFSLGTRAVSGCRVEFSYNSKTYKDSFNPAELALYDPTAYEVHVGEVIKGNVNTDGVMNVAIETAGGDTASEILDGYTDVTLRVVYRVKFHYGSAFVDFGTGANLKHKQYSTIFRCVKHKEKDEINVPSMGAESCYAMMLGAHTAITSVNVTEGWHYKKKTELSYESFITGHHSIWDAIGAKYEERMGVNTLHNWISSDPITGGLSNVHIKSFHTGIGKAGARIERADFGVAFLAPPLNPMTEPNEENVIAIPLGAGKYHNQNIYGTSLSEVEQMMREKHSKLQNGAYAINGRMKLEYLFSQWLTLHDDMMLSSVGHFRANNLRHMQLFYLGSYSLNLHNGIADVRLIHYRTMLNPRYKRVTSDGFANEVERTSQRANINNDLRPSDEELLKKISEYKLDDRLLNYE